MNQHQRIIIAVGIVLIVALGLWPPFQDRGQYQGQHFLFDPAYNSARIDLVRLGIGWFLVVLTFAIILLLYRVFSLRVVKIFGLTVTALLLIAVTVALAVKYVRIQAYAALTQQAQSDLAAITITSTSETNFVLSNPTKWELSASSFTIDYITVRQMILFSSNQPSSSLRPHSQATCTKVPVSSLSYGQRSQLPQKSPFIQRLTVRYNRATAGDQTVVLDPPFELVSERYFVFYPDEWGWDKLAQSSYLLGSAEFKEVSSSTQPAPTRRLASPPSDSIPDFRVVDP